MKYILALLLLVPNLLYADITRYFDACGFLGMQVGQSIYTAEYINQGLNEDDYSRLIAEIALIKLGQSQVYEINLKVFYPQMRCS